MHSNLLTAMGLTGLSAGQIRNLCEIFTDAEEQQEYYDNQPRFRTPHYPHFRLLLRCETGEKIPALMPILITFVVGAMARVALMLPDITKDASYTIRPTFSPLVEQQRFSHHAEFNRGCQNILTLQLDKMPPGTLYTVCSWRVTAPHPPDYDSRPTHAFIVRKERANV